MALSLFWGEQDMVLLAVVHGEGEEDLEGGDVVSQKHTMEATSRS